MKRPRLAAFLLLCLLVGMLAIINGPVRRALHPALLWMRGTVTVEQKLAELAPAEARLIARFQHAGVPFPPPKAALVGLKSERSLQIYAQSSDGTWSPITQFPIIAASGTIGPKLFEGDRQVPEGIYAAEALNPNSRFHVSVRIGYPNEDDKRQARLDGRTKLGGDIMIHGGASSVGCLAIGDPAAEKVFSLAARVGLPNIKIVLAPSDLRTAPIPADPSLARAVLEWV